MAKTRRRSFPLRILITCSGTGKVPFRVEERRNDAKPVRIEATREYGEQLLKEVAQELQELLARTPARAAEYEASDEDFFRDLDIRFLRRRARETLERLASVIGRAA